MGQGNQKCFDLCAGKVGSQRKNTLQNGSALNQTAGANPAFFVPLLVLQNLLSVFKLPNLLQDFLPFFFLGIVSEELWSAAQVKLLAQSKRYEPVNRSKTEQAHLLSRLR